MALSDVHPLLRDVLLEGRNRLSEKQLRGVLGPNWDINSPQILPIVSVQPHTCHDIAVQVKPLLMSTLFCKLGYREVGHTCVCLPLILVQVLQAVASRCDVETLSDGDCVLKSGVVANKLYVIKSGRVICAH